MRVAAALTAVWRDALSAQRIFTLTRRVYTRRRDVAAPRLEFGVRVAIVYRLHITQRVYRGNTVSNY